VILDAQIGPRLQRILPPKLAQRVMATVFVGVGILVMAVEIGTQDPPPARAASYRKSPDG